MASHPSSPTQLKPESPRLLDLVRLKAREHFNRPEPGERYAAWVLRFVLFHDKRHPRDLSPIDAVQFLSHLAHTEKEPLAAAGWHG